MEEEMCPLSITVGGCLVCHIYRKEGWQNRIVWSQWKW